MSRVDVLGVHVDQVDHDGVRLAIESAVRLDRKSVFAYVNVHAINIAQRDRRFREFLDGCNLVYCDGDGVRLGARLLGHRLPPRIVLTYFVWDLCRSFERSGISIFLLGSERDKVEEAVERLRVRFPQLKILGWHHGLFEKSGPESERVVESINSVEPDVLFVGFGMPVQEHWIEDNFVRLKTKVLLPCGSMIDYVSGRKSKAPAWMSSNGMEWLYRIFEEPRRLWRRYLIGNPVFMLRIFAQRFGMRRTIDDK